MRTARPYFSGWFPKNDVRIAVALACIQNPKLRRRVAELLEEIIANESEEVRSLTG